MLSFSSLFYVKNIEDKYVTMHIQIICKNKQSIICLQFSFIALLFIPNNKITHKSLTCRLLSKKVLFWNWTIDLLVKGTFGVGMIENKVNSDNYNTLSRSHVVLELCTSKLVYVTTLTIAGNKRDLVLYFSKYFLKNIKEEYYSPTISPWLSYITHLY